MVRELINPGDIIFNRNKGLWSKLLRAFTLSQWSHVGIVIGRHQGKITCVSARFGGVVYDNLIDWGSEVQIKRIRDINECQIQKMISYISTQVGKKPISCGIFCNSMFVHLAFLKAGLDIFKEKKKIITVGDIYESPKLQFIAEI